MEFLDGIATASAIRRGEIKLEDVVRDAINRAQQVNPMLNAIATDDFVRASNVSADSVGSILAGVPTFLKDMEELAGVRTMFGSKAFANYIPESDGPTASRWKQAGLVLLGKTTTSEGAMTAATEALITGITRNPWDLSKSASGSSGGAAALTAARVVPFCHGTDGGGSIRMPASVCGLFGFKPTNGRVNHATNTDVPVDIVVDHAISWTVRDSAALFQITETGEYETIGAITGPSSRRLKIAYAPEPIYDAQLHPEVRAACEATVTLLRDMGHEVVEFTMPFDGHHFFDMFTLYIASYLPPFAEAASAVSGKPIGPDILDPLTLGILKVFHTRSQELDEAILHLQQFAHDFNALFYDFDVLMSPTLATPPVVLGTYGPVWDVQNCDRSEREFGPYVQGYQHACFTQPMNVAAAPSMSVPLQSTSDGLPVGILFSARKGEDKMLLELAYELEESKPWIDALPSVHA